MVREMSLAGFITHLATLTIETDHETHRGLEKVGKLIEAEAKKSLGTYQDGAGPFAAWAELADATKDDRVRQGYSENDPGLRSGEMRDSISHQVETHAGGGEVVIGSNDDKMVFFELGTSKQPPRSDLGGALFRNRERVVEILGRSVVGALIGEGVIDGALGVIGTGEE